jgi:excisionase family DNA binding protein
MAANTIEPLLNSKEVGQILGVHPKVAERMVKRGELPGFKVARFFRYSPSALQAWIEAHSRSAVESNRQACRIQPEF